MNAGETHFDCSIPTYLVRTMDRSKLIDRKHQVIAQIQQARREMEPLRMRADRRSKRRVRAIEERLEKLMAEEYRLRIEIDQAR